MCAEHSEKHHKTPLNSPTELLVLKQPVKWCGQALNAIYKCLLYL